MKGYPKAAQGLYKVFVGQALSSALSPLLAGSSLEGLVLLAGMLLYLFGLRQARSDDKRYGIALILAVVVLIVNFTANLASVNYPVIGSLGRMAITVLNLITLFFVCKATSALCMDVGQEKTAKLGRPVLWMNVVCAAVSLILSVLSLIPGLASAQASLSYFALFIALLGSLMYIWFLFRASRVLVPSGYTSTQTDEDDYDEYDEYDEYGDEYDEDYDENEEMSKEGAPELQAGGAPAEKETEE